MTWGLDSVILTGHIVVAKTQIFELTFEKRDHGLNRVIVVYDRPKKERKRVKKYCSDHFCFKAGSSTVGGKDKIAYCEEETYISTTIFGEKNTN